MSSNDQSNLSGKDPLLPSQKENEPPESKGEDIDAIDEFYKYDYEEQLMDKKESKQT